MNINLMTIIMLAATMTGGGVARAADEAVLPATPETQDQHDARMAWWREARFGMFIHWGLYAIPARGEWVMYKQKPKIPVAEYARYAETFNPVKFDAAFFAKTAKDAGMKYVVLTAKHHDGFAMFATHASPFNIVDATPFKRDVVKELSEACRKAGLKFGVYYSQGQDWHHPGGGKLGQWDPAQAGDEDKFIRTIVIPQVHELLANYGDLDLFWWDSGVSLWTPEHGERAALLYREFVPFKKIVINNRLYDSYRKLQFKPDYWTSTNSLERFIRGDFATPEEQFPGSVPQGIDWETCGTINGYWGYRSAPAKSVSTLVRNLVDVASKGGNYLLNIGPDAEGAIPATSVDSLRGVGEWLKVNGMAIYGTSASPFPGGVPWGRVTQKGRNLYLLVFARPNDNALLLPGLKTAPKTAYMLADVEKKPLAVVAGELGVTVTLPAGLSMDPAATVVVVELAGKAVVGSSPVLSASNPLESPEKLYRR